MSKHQHSKGRKRPRAWHRGRRTGAHAAKALGRIEDALRRGAPDEPHAPVDYPLTPAEDARRRAAEGHYPDGAPLEDYTPEG